MSYALLYTDKAVSQLERVPAEFVDLLEINLHRLADTPASLSVAIASPPFPPRGQLYHFEVRDSANRRWFFTVIFRYSQGETALHVLSVTWRELIDE